MLNQRNHLSISVNLLLMKVILNVQLAKLSNNLEKVTQASQE